MEIRKVKPEELIWVERNMSVAFNYSIDQEKWLKEANEYDFEASPAWGAFNDDNNLMASVINNQYTVNFAGNQIKMGGIGGVATFPEYRKGGLIRGIISEILKDAYKKGEVFSALHPFSHVFYRKFGYEYCDARQDYKIPLKVLAFLKNELQVKSIEKGENVLPYLELTNNYAKNYTLTVIRDEKQLSGSFKRINPYGSNTYGYAFYKDNALKGYIIFKKEYQQNEGNLVVLDYVFDEANTFRSMLGFLSKLTANFDNAVISAPQCLNIQAICEEPYDIQRKTDDRLMCRVVNVKTVLELLKDRCQTQLTVKVTDPIIEENSKCFKVTREGVCEYEGPCDIEADITRFSQLAVGYINVISAKYLDKITINGNEDEISRVFTQKDIMLQIYF